MPATLSQICSECMRHPKWDTLSIHNAGLCFSGTSWGIETFGGWAIVPILEVVVILEVFLLLCYMYNVLGCSTFSFFLQANPMLVPLCKLGG
jgi:hypothetical protein